MDAKLTIYCTCSFIVLIVCGVLSSEKSGDSVKKVLSRTRFDLKELIAIVNLMKKRIPEEIHALIQEDPQVISLQEYLMVSRNEQCTQLFSEKLRNLVNDVSAETMESFRNEANDFRGTLLNVWKQLSSKPAKTVEKKSDDLSEGEYHDILQFVNKDLKYEEDSSKVMESSFVEYAREKLQKELERRGIIHEIESCCLSSS